MRSDRGQAAADYAAVLLVVAVALAAVTAAAVPGVGERVVAAVRTGVCIVGGDFCRDSDARAAGLEPCVASRRESGTETTVDVMSLRVGQDGRWTVAVRSDGSVEVARADGRTLGATAGLQLRLAGFQDLGVAGSAVATRESGRAWRFGSVAEAQRFLADALGPDPRAVERFPPAERWTAFGERGEASAGATLPILGSAGARLSLDGAVGRRTGGGRTSWFFRAERTDPQWFATLPAWSSAATAQDALVELSADAGGARELVIRTAHRTPERVEELIARLDPRDPEVRARLGDGAPWPPAVVRNLARHAARRGVVERQVHVVDDRSRTYGGSAKLLVALGIEHTRVDVRMRLADASVWIAGSGPRRRADCLARTPLS